MSQHQADGGYRRFHGKYRGKVIENIDPLFMGRIIAEVPAVPGSTMNFAMPCVPYAGLEVGFYAIPPIGANVWIEFEGGDPNYPIWVGCFWAELELPPLAPTPETKFFKTENITMILNDMPVEGGFTLLCTPPAVDIPLTMLFNSEGIKIICPEAEVTMTPASISLTVPESNVTLTPETITASVAPTEITMSAATISAESPDISATAEAGIEISAGADVSITAGGAVEVTSGGELALSSGGAMELTAALELAMTSGLAAELTAGLDVAITAAVATEITAVSVDITGATEVTGDLLIDGQQPLMI